jgi:hypothetical protein
MQRRNNSDEPTRKTTVFADGTNCMDRIKNKVKK